MAAKIPLVFGVTGHRDIATNDFRTLEDRVCEVFRRYRIRYPSTPLMLLTSLADGGDRIAANAALRESVEIVPVLPMAQTEYENDFIRPGSLAEFRQILARSSPPIVLSRDVDNVSAPLSSTGASSRMLLYETAGIYVAVHCSLLIAIWDGYFIDDPAEQPNIAGTAAIVRFRCEGTLASGHPLPPFCRREARVLDAPESGPIVYIAAKRSGSSRMPSKDPFAENERKPSRTEIERHEQSLPEDTFAHLESYNQNAAHIGVSLRGMITKSAAYLMPDGEARKHPDIETLRLRFATADVLSIAFRDRVQGVLFLISLFALAAFVCFDLFANICHSPLLLAAYLGILIIPWGVYTFVVKPQDWQGKYLDYRALAEALRVQYFWQVAGIPANAADFYLRRHTGELTWIRHAARACNIGPMPVASDTGIAAARQYWIVDQKKWLGTTAEREKMILGKWNRWILCFYLAGIVMSAGVLGASLANVGMTGLPLHASICLMGLAPALAATMGFVLEHRAYESHIKQYRFMTRLYTRADDALGNTTDLSAERDIIEAIGREALAENGDWFFMHRDRRVAPPR